MVELVQLLEEVIVLFSFLVVVERAVLHLLLSEPMLRLVVLLLEPKEMAVE